MKEGPRVNFVMREALFEIYTWILCLSYLYEKQTSRIQSLYLYFIKIVPFWLWYIRFLIHNKAVFRTAARAAGSYVTLVTCWKNGCQNFSYVYRSRKHWKCKYIVMSYQNSMCEINRNFNLSIDQRMPCLQRYIEEHKDAARRTVMFILEDSSLTAMLYDCCQYGPVEKAYILESGKVRIETVRRCEAKSCIGNDVGLSICISNFAEVL